MMTSTSSETYSPRQPAWPTQQPADREEDVVGSTSDELATCTLACNKCGKTGHIGRVCRSRIENATRSKDLNTEVSNNGVIVAFMATLMDYPTINVEVTLQTMQVTQAMAAMADTGARYVSRASGTCPP